MGPGACVSKEVRPQKQKRKLGSPRAIRRGGNSCPQLSAGCTALKQARRTTSLGTGICKGAAGGRTNVQKECLSLRLSRRQQSVNFSCEPAGHQSRAAHSWRYLQLLSESASRLPALQLYTRLRLTPRATSAPGLAAPRCPCASPPARETRGSPPASCELGQTGRE